MTENHEASGTPNRNECGETYGEYLKRAVSACEAGDLVLGMHLYLAAYEKGVVDPGIADGMALTGLREAWRLACELKERSMAEYVFEKLEPYLTGEEIASCAKTLQDLALDRLEQYGFSREELEEMAGMITQDFAGDASVMKVESISIPNVGIVGVSAYAPEVPDEHDDEPQPVAADDDSNESFPAANETEETAGQEEDRFEPTTAAKKRGKPNHVGMGTAPADGFNPYDYYAENSIGTSYHSATNEGSGAYVFTRDVERAEAGMKAAEEAQRKGSAGGEKPRAAHTEDANGESERQGASEDKQAQQGKKADAGKPAGISKSGKADMRASGDRNAADNTDLLNYRNLAGYDEAISAMRDLGIGLHNDRSFLDFVGLLNEQHGLTRAPALDTLLFRAEVIEDAARFVDATIGEIGLPALRLSMEEGYQGAQMLCVTTQGNNRPRMNHAHNRFEAPAILVIENLDTWVMPAVPENAEGVNGWIMANISRGAREAVNLIRSAVEDPDVYVLATASTTGDADPFFYDVLEPITIIDIDLPNDKERSDLWTEIAQEHPSMRAVSRPDLTRLSAGLSRYDIYLAAREAVEEAYKLGLVQRSYVPVSPHNIFEKLAACLPLDTEEYQALEDEVIRSFQSELDNLENLLSNTQEEHGQD